MNKLPKSAKDESLFLTKDKNVEPFIKRLCFTLQYSN